jgi:protein subunit release factor A
MTDIAELIARLQAAALAEIDHLYQEAAAGLAAQAQEIERCLDVSEREIFELKQRAEAAEARARELEVNQEQRIERARQYMNRIADHVVNEIRNVLLLESP